MKIEPLDDRVVIEILDAEEKTAGGIVLPDTAKEKPQKGKIVATGPGKLLEDGSRAKPLVKKGDIVLFGKYSGTEVRVNDVEYTIMRESDILAKEKK
ncbi:MAG TPA: co-chaperone GroES [Planctomycetota bacterium]|nr:co-chaperone GroES [Planctomycetota bacterium]